MTRRLNWGAAAPALLLLLSSAGSAEAKEPRVFFSPQDAFQNALVKELLGAKKSIDIALYSFQATSKSQEADYAQRVKRGDITPLDALRERLEAGVKVRVVLNKGAYDAANSKTARHLVEAGAQVHTVSGTMHSKFAIIDGETVINGSGNWSIGAFNRYHENWIFFPPDKELAAAFQANMDAMLAEKQRLVVKGEGLDVDKGKAKKVKKSKQGAAGVWFTTDNEGEETTVVEDALVKGIRAAKKELLIAVAHFNTPRLSDEVIKAHKKGVKVRVLVDLGEYRNRVSRAMALEKAGVDVRYHAYSVKMFFPFAQLMHHKFMVVDGKRLFSGSYNWSRTAEWKNHENVQLLEQPALVGAFEDEFEALWELRRPGYEQFMTRLKAKKGTDDYRRFLPCHFPPMALSAKEMAALRRVYIKAGFSMRPYKGKRPTSEFWNLDREKRVGTNDLPESPHKPFFDVAGLVISEVCHSPDRQASAEFIELYNSGTVDVDLTEYTLSDGDDEDPLIRIGRRRTTLAPGKTALIVDPDYRKKDDYAIPRGVVVVTVGDKTLGNGLSKDDVVTLKAKGGAVVDTCPLRGPGKSLHRRNLTQAGDAGNWEVAEPSPGVVGAASK